MSSVKEHPVFANGAQIILRKSFFLEKGTTSVRSTRKKASRGAKREERLQSQPCLSQKALPVSLKETQARNHFPEIGLIFQCTECKGTLLSRLPMLRTVQRKGSAGERNAFAFLQVSLEKGLRVKRQLQSNLCHFQKAVLASLRDTHGCIRKANRHSKECAFPTSGVSGTLAFFRFLQCFAFLQREQSVCALTELGPENRKDTRVVVRMFLWGETYPIL